MASTTATITIASADLLTDDLSFSTTTSLSTAGTATGLSNTTGLARTTTLTGSTLEIQSVILYRGEDATANGANKIYLKNTSATATEYFTIHVDGEELGRLYAQDWCFFPWNAHSGTGSTFTVTIASTWAANDTWEFDGITMTAANGTTADIAAQIDGLNYPNWTTAHGAGESTVAFTHRQAGGLTQSTAVTADGTLNTAGNGTANISGGAAGTGKSESDISVRPSVHTAMTLEHMLFYQ